MGEYRQLHTDDGTFAVYVELPANTPAPAVVVLPEIFGINADMRETCQELARQGFIALCPDLFWRLEPGVELNSWSEEEWKKGFALYQAFDIDLGVRDVGATVAMGRALPESNGKCGLMGFCLGGLMTFLTTAREGVDAAAAYYGGQTDQYLGEADSIRAPMIMHLGTEDEFISTDAQAAIKAAMKDRTNVTVYAYPGCSHAFARHTGLHYDAAAAELANERTYDLFRRELAGT
ncbi:MULTISPECIES: dienelactone hydrolase family protein [unclassified Caballeronia]|uniref:dienelactone hydrolase family protein n=1 Tax=unclassified Caballeronia TaxID=2646786 RepID=UPI002027824E|nr:MULTISPECIES: dienelactone hydrolase family protein [unclassified Caballeronia]MDR5800257.1 dienelactone hydrolase family protein [Caballeronia sp. LZ001]